MAFLSLIFLGGCQAYHDTTARFNAYFLSKQKMAEAEEALFGEPTNDYNDILQVMVPIDTNQTLSQKTAFDYVIEKASLPVQWHETSQWVDDCYLLIGKARMYQGDYMNASLTYKYVNTNSEENYARHQALVLLMRNFIESKEYNNMFATLDEIRKEKAPFNEENTRDYHLTMSHYYRQVEEYDMIAEHLERALPLIDKKKDKARFYFILGQIYELQGKEELAFENYSQVIKSNPGYELFFHADLNRSGVKKLETEEDVNKASKYYRRLLSDEKNWEFRDKIYYEMALFEIKRETFPNALNYLSESVQVSTSNPVQKAYSYLKMGEIYHERYKDYEKAAAYYDSTMQVMPPDTKNYETVKTTAENLQVFVKHLTTVKEQDRLLELKDMPEEELTEYLVQEIEKEKESILKTRENENLSAAKRQQAPSSGQEENEGGEEGGWYFYNTSATVFGRTNFLRIWGTRPLEDNWRRSFKENITFQQQGQRTGRETQEEESVQEDIFASVKSAEQRKSEIPTSDEEVAAIEAKLQSGLFELGKVYYYRLHENQNTIATLERLAQEYPNSEYTPEALYILYLLCTNYDSCEMNTYKNLLVEDYPTSFYARILINTNYVEESNIVNQKAAALYETGYSLYQNEQYEQADSVLQSIHSLYPKNNIMDKVKLLSILITGKTTEDLDDYYQELNQFIDSHQESSLVPYAKNLLSGLSEESSLFEKQSTESPPSTNPPGAGEEKTQKEPIPDRNR